MSRRELREQIFLLLFRVEFNDPADMPEQMRLFLEDEETARSEADTAYIAGKYEKIMEKLPEIDGQINEKAENWDNDSLYEVMVQTAKDNGLKNGQILWPVRTALSGKPTTPCGASELCVLLGKEETLKRLSEGIEILTK